MTGKSERVGKNGKSRGLRISKNEQRQKNKQMINLSLLEAFFMSKYSR